MQPRKPKKDPTKKGFTNTLNNGYGANFTRKWKADQAAAGQTPPTVPPGTKRPVMQQAASVLFAKGKRQVGQSLTKLAAAGTTAGRRRSR